MLEGMQRAGADVPALNVRPDISGLEWIWEAFWWLSTCRSRGMDVGPIPWTAIDRYREVEEMSPFETRMLFASIRTMDDAFLKHVQSRRKKEIHAQQPSAKKPVPRKGGRT